MNFLAHGHRCLHDPWLLVGSALPDWLGAALPDGRMLHLRTEMVGRHVADPGMLGSLARGIERHLADDRWFHSAPEFLDLCERLSRTMRPLAAATGDNVRVSFVAHVLIELLIDAELDARDPRLVERYYEQLEAIDGVRLEEYLSAIAGRPVTGVAGFLSRFISWRFLGDYRDDAKLLLRINQVLGRVSLPPMSSGLRGYLPEFRSSVLPLVEMVLAR